MWKRAGDRARRQPALTASEAEPAALQYRGFAILVIRGRRARLGGRMTDAVPEDFVTAPAPIAPVGPAAARATPYSKAYTRYAMVLMLGIYAVNYIDRQIINILGEPIKHDLKLSDGQLGLLGGLAFAVLYTFLGIPIARLAETGNRPRIISIAAVTWSGFTLLCAAAGNFWQILLFRVGVGVGEAGCAAPSHSLVVDYHPMEKRASALAFYSLGSPIGTAAGLVMGGLVFDAYGWRAAFVVAGLPGLLFGVVAFFTLREPRRLLARQAAAATATAVSFGQTLAHLFKRRTFWLVGAGATLINAPGSTFTASFFLRNHAAEVARLAQGLGVKPLGFLGLAIGLTHVAGALGVWSSGWLTDRYGVRDLRNYTIAPAIAALLAIPVRLAQFTVESTWVALALLAVSTFLGALWWGPVFSVGQSVVPPRMRATSAAILIFMIVFIGSFGGLGVGVLSDYFNHGLGMGLAEGVRWALLAVTGVWPLAFACFWLARRTIREDFVG